jgi:hypothetical protein
LFIDDCFIPRDKILIAPGFNPGDERKVLARTPKGFNKRGTKGM